MVDGERRGLRRERHGQDPERGVVDDGPVRRRERRVETERKQPGRVGRVDGELGGDPDTHVETGRNRHVCVPRILTGPGTRVLRLRRGVDGQVHGDAEGDDYLIARSGHGCAKAERSSADGDAGPRACRSACVEQLTREPQATCGDVERGCRRWRRDREVDEHFDRKRQERNAAGCPHQVDVSHDREDVDPVLAIGAVLEGPEALRGLEAVRPFREGACDLSSDVARERAGPAVHKSGLCFNHVGDDTSGLSERVGRP